MSQPNPFNRRQPSEAVMGELGDYAELVGVIGTELIATEDALAEAEERAARRHARRNRSGMTPDAVGRGRA